MSRLLFSILTIFFCLFFTSLSAAHIVGGDVTYTCVSSNPVTRTTIFKVTFTLYRDQSGTGAQFDNNARFGVFERDLNGSAWSFKENITRNPINRENVTYDDQCVVVPPNIRIEKANYELDVELPWGEKVYQIVYQRCCRNNTINNIVNPGETGAAFFVEIFGDAIEKCNNSPVFNKFPPILICNNRPINFDHSATDAEGDRLEYEFCAPLKAGGTDGATTPGNPSSCTGITPLPNLCPPPYAEIVYNPTYSATNPMGGSPQVSLDPTTGLISGVPTILGQYVVGVCVKEFRNGKQIGSIRRDFQFNVVICQGISETVNYTICKKDSITINQTTYNQAGQYSQLFQSTFGCDSTLNINITYKPTQESFINSTICEGDTLIVNGQSYTDTGNYQQLIETGAGCDSIINITLVKNNKTSGRLDYRICDDETVTVNGNIYNSGGVFTQSLSNINGCDSTLSIYIEQLNQSEALLQFQLCDDEVALVNGVSYDTEGSYSQLLQNSAGCDSLVNIEIKKGQSSEETLTYSLCDQNPVTVNGTAYDKEGQYVVNLTSGLGCDSVLVINILPCDQNIYYDLEKCDALVPANSMVYDEFTPKYQEALSCGQIVAKNIFRENPQMNKHSCTPGNNNSIGMCISAAASCDYNLATITPIVLEWQANPAPGQKIQLNHFIFYQNAPLNYDWIAGPKGINNYPTKYGIRVLKNNVEIFKASDINTSNSWTKEKYDFFQNDLFSTADSALFRIEMIPYCQKGINAPVSVWDVDDLSLYFSCHPIDQRKISGQIINSSPLLAEAKIRRIKGNTMITVIPKADGSFELSKNQADETYIIEGYLNNNTLEGLTTLDIVLTQRHILGLQTFTSPLQYLAADVNNDQKVTASDLLIMRKLILGMDTEYKQTTSWIFLDESSIKTESNPWKIKRHVMVTPGHPDITDIQFRAVKVGDVDGVSEDNLDNGISNE